MTYAYAKPGGMANSARSTGSKDEIQTVNAFDFEFRRIPAVFDGRRTVETTNKGEIVETCGVFVKGNASGILMTVSRWERENGKSLGKMQWNAFVHFTIDGKYVDTDTYTPDSLPEKYCKDNREWLEEEMKKLLKDSRMKDDICKRGKMKAKESASTNLDVGREVERAYRQGRMKYEDVEKCLELAGLAEKSARGSKEWQKLILEVAEMIRKVYGSSYETTSGVSMCVRGLFGKDMPVLVEDVRDCFRGPKRVGMETVEEA